MSRARRLLAVATALLGACGGKPDPKQDGSERLQNHAARRASGPVAATAAPTTKARPTPLACADSAPTEACEQLKKQLGARVTWAKGAPHQLSACKPGEGRPIGYWHYALVAPSYSPVQSISSARMRAAWQGKDDALGLQVSADTRAALEAIWGPAGSKVTTLPARAAGAEPPGPSHEIWVITPAHELTPHFKVVMVDEVFPIGPGSSKSALRVPLCVRGPGGGAPSLSVALGNIDPKKLTALIMTGVTALTRNTAVLIDNKGPRYLAKDVKPWFRASADFVHVSNEVSFVPKCKTVTRGISFCSKDHYIKTLEELNTNIVELTGSHLSDFGRKWITRSVEMYAKRGWKWFGGGRSQIEATRPLLIEHNGNKLGFIGCNVQRTDEKWIRSGPSTAFCDHRRMQWQVRDMVRRGIVPIVSIQHWEIPGYMPSTRIVKEFRRLAEAGARFVFGSQAHEPKPWELHHGAFIHYGAGNFLFDQVKDISREGVVDRLIFHDNRLLTVQMRFTWTEDRGRPTWMSEQRRERFVRTLEKHARRISRRKAAEPWAEVAAHQDKSRHRPDSYLAGKHPQALWVHVPKGADDAEKKWPLVIFLHGQDELGGDMARIRTKALPKFLDEAPDKYPYFVASPHMPKSPGLRIERIMGTLEFMLAKYPIDPDRVYLTGFSLGALYSWKTAVAHPKPWAAIATVSGFGIADRACAVKEIPVWAFHGTRDVNVPSSASRKMIDAIKKCDGAKAKLTLYDGVDHEGAWAKAYADPELFKWLLSHRRPSR